jgi:hypothetical protein
MKYSLNHQFDENETTPASMMFEAGVESLKQT